MAGDTKLAVGSKAPDFMLPGDGGEAVKLSGLRGRPVVLFFYPQDDTETCTKEALSFSDLRAKFDEVGAAVLGISPDSVEKHGRFRRKYGLTVNLLADIDHVVIRAYGLWTEKTMFGRTYMGVERATFLIGADGTIRHIWRKVRVAGHAEQVLTRIGTT